MIRRGITALRAWHELRREERLPEEKLEQIQWERFLRIIRHAYEASPFYRRRFDDAGITPEDIRTRDDLGRIPILEREDLRRPKQLIARGYASAKLFRSFSSGVTGERAETFFDSKAWLLGKMLLKIRARLACGVRPWHRIALFKFGDLENSAARRLFLRQEAYPVHDQIDAILPRLLRYAPNVLYGLPGHYRQLIEKYPDRLRPKIVFTSGEMLDGDTRGLIEERFGVPVYDVYGCTEVKEIAWECPERSGYHVNADRLLVETVGPSKCAGEEHRDIVVTSLYNYAMPLIRYRIGDTGRLIDRKCPCGRSLPLMTPGFSRSCDFFVLPDGGLVSPYVMIKTVEVLPGFGRFQIVQEETDRVVMRIVPHGPDGGSAASAIRRKLTPLLPNVRLDIVETQEIPPEPSGKFRITASKVPRP